MKIRDQVVEFHRAFGAPVSEVPQVPQTDRVDLRLRLIAEEFCELLEACGCDEPLVRDLSKEIGKLIRLRKSNDVDIVSFADACGDIDYVVEGSRLEFGIDGAPIADAIHRSNMRKLGGEVRSDGKIQKPSGWLPPDIEGCLRAQGWKGVEAKVG